MSAKCGTCGSTMTCIGVIEDDHGILKKLCDECLNREGFESETIRKLKGQ